MKTYLSVNMKVTTEGRKEEQEKKRMRIKKVT